jgi:uncharacterized protein
MSAFIDRAEELADLGSLWGMERQTVLLWGRRRVGKTRLLDEFVSDKPAIVYQADEGTMTEQLARLTERILAYQEDGQLAAQPLDSWDAAIAVLLRLVREAKAARRPLLVVFDEFPRLVASHAALPSKLQTALETVRREDLPLFLVLAGSQIALFEKHVLQGPLYSRRSWGEQLAPLGYREAGAFFVAWEPVDRLRAWSFLGGIPYYLEQWDAGRSLRWNIVNRLLRKGSVLYQEAELMIKEELSAEAGVYLSIIAAIAAGRTRPSEIGDLAGVEPRAVSKYLDQLSRLHMVEHLQPAGAPRNARRGIWRLSDPYLRAWFAFVRANRTDLEARRGEAVFRERVAPRLDQFVSRPAFEDAVREHVRQMIGVDPQFPQVAEVGAWWGPVPDERYPGTRRTREGEIEVVGYDGTKLVLAAEAKWSGAPLASDALERLRSTAIHAPGYSTRDTRLAIYARGGFTERFRRAAHEQGVILRTVDDLYSDT